MAEVEIPGTDPAGAIRWRLVGPFRGGRVVAVAGDPSDPTFYFGSTGGGVWKTTDGGSYWENISDGFFKRASVGAIAVAHSDPNVIYVGMGETTIRGNVSHGDGVYKSTDGGQTWKHMRAGGDAQHRARCASIPRIPTSSTSRRSATPTARTRSAASTARKDGGETWEHVLFRNERDAGADRPRDGPAQPAHPLRRLLGGAARPALR